jgi:hypothetical protein
MPRKVAVYAALALALVGASAVLAAGGNGAPSGAHYNLNLIGVPQDKSADMTDNNGRRIFMPLWRKARINLSEGDYQVLDANGTDGVAAFQLPNPDPDGDGTTAYSVYVRALGKPGGKAVLQSCFEDTTGTWCAADFAGGVEPIMLERKNGKSSFENVTQDLLFVDVCIEFDLSGACVATDQIPLFSDDTKSYLWDYDNSGLKLAQLRFYEVPTTVSF